MPRNYVPKPKSYTDSRLQEAVEKVQNGELTYRDAESMYSIDKSLLWRRVHNYNASKQGRKTVLSQKEEEDLADKIKIMAKWGWALTRTEIREIVHNYIVQNGIKNNFKDNYPGKDWMQLFFSRNGLVSKKMEQLEKSRRQATSDPFILYHFYGILEEVLTAMDLHDKPQNIFNLDETSFSSDPSRIKGVTGKGQTAHRIIQGSGKDNTNVLGCVSAAGTLLPPLIIFKGQNLWSSWKGTKDIPGTTYACSDNGWMMTRIFNEWFEIFLKTVTERPLLVIFDGHVTHLDPATIGLAIRENVALLKLPAHTTDLLQPMDRSCFGPIKYKWNVRLIEWQRLNQRSLTKSEFADLLCEVWRDGLSKEVIQNSFKVTGLYPVNKEVYPKDRLDPVKLDRYNKIHSSFGLVQNPLNIFEDADANDNADANANTDTNANANADADANADCVSPSLLEPETSSVYQDIEREIIHAAESTDTQQNVQPELTLPLMAAAGFHISCSESSSSFESLLLSKIKQTKPVTAKRRKIDGKGKLLTSEEYLKSIENLEKPKKRQKKREPKKKLNRKTAQMESDTDTDIGEEVVPYDDESDLENISLSAIIEDEQAEELDEPHREFIKSREAGRQQAENVPFEVEINENLTSKSYEDNRVNKINELEYGIGDFILVVHTTQKNKKFYIARIEGSDDEENLTVIYLKRAKKIFFVYPDTHIHYTIRKDEIVMKLPSPKQKKKRGALMFDIDLEKYNVE